MANDTSTGISAVSAQAGQKTGMEAGAKPKIDKQLFEAGVVKTTLDYMNSDPGGASGTNADYDFQTKVLEGGFMAKGMMVKGKV